VRKTEKNRWWRETGGRKLHVGGGHLIDQTEKTEQVGGEEKG